MSENTWTVLNEAHAALRTVVAGVGDWDVPTPCVQWTATQVLQHAAGDQIGFASAITGQPGPTWNPFDPSGRLDESPVSYLETALGASADAWATVAPDTQEVPVPVPPNKMSAELGVTACALDAAVHAWDIAVATGRPSPLTPELARPLMAAALRIVEPLRAYGAYAAPVEGDSADDVEELLRYLGRDPRWSPAL